MDSMDLMDTSTSPTPDVSRLRLDQLIRGLRRAPSAAIPRRTAGVDRVPASFAQRRSWLLDRLAPGSPVYNLPGLLHLEGELRPAALAAALSEIVRRHEALRTTFTAEAGEPFQVIHPAGTVPLPMVDLSRVQTGAAELARREAHRPFDLERGPLLRTLLLRLAPDRHALSIVFHHAIADGWSLEVFLGELATLYGAFAEGRPSPLSELPIQVADHALWQRDQETGAQLDFWRRELAGVPVLELPADHPRRGGSDLAGLRVPVEIVRGARGLAARLGTTPFVVLLAASAAVLGRLAGQEEVALGTPVAGRGRRELEGLIGFLVNTLVLRLSLTGEPSFAELVEQARAKVLSAGEHQEVPFERLVEELAPAREVGSTPLFQVMVSLDQTLAPRTAAGVRFVPEKLATETAKLEAALQFEEVGEEIGGSIEARRALFEPATLRRWARHLAVLLEAGAREPERSVFELPLLGAGERHQLLSEWNDRHAPAPAGCVHEWFVAWAERQPDAVAVVSGEEHLSYGELERRTRWPAANEPLVAVLHERSPAFVIAVVGVARAGAAWLPIDPSLPEERIAGMLADSGASRVPAVGPGQLAYVIYTSGSTGKPKGAELTHAGLANLIAWHAVAYGTGPGERWTQIASPGFDAATWEVWAGLALGASLHLPPQAVVQAPRALGAWLRDERITLAHLPTPLAEALFAEGLPAGLALRRLLVGSDRLRRVPEGLGFELVNQYGPTEATVLSTWGAVEPGAESPPIGRPLANVAIHLLDRRGRPVPVGSAGELTIGGAGVGRGYLRRPSLTAERFVPDGFGGEAGARLYRSGDLARWRGDGQIDFLGRIDRQVKLRGFRIEIGEIEATLLRHTGVAEAVVLAPETAGERRLVAVVMGEGLSEESLKTFLSAHLPGYMVPSAFAIVDEMPRLPSGKVDRRELESLLPAAEPVSVAPRGLTEELLAQIWSELLGVESVGAEDDFFALGGHSLRAAQVLARVHDAFGAEVPLARFFARPTVRGLAEAIELPAAKTAPLVAEKRTGPPPLSFAQERAWFLWQLDPGSAAYNMPARVRLAGRLEVAALQAALLAVVERHEPLRVRFGEMGQEWAPWTAWTLPLVDLSRLPEKEKVLHRLARAEAARPFDLTTGPLLRATLLRLGAAEHALLLTIHHVAADGWSVGVLAREIGAVYSALVAGQTPVLPALTITYGDYAAWQRREPAEGQLGYWRERLTEVPVLELPADHPAGAVRGGHLPVHLDRDLTAGLARLARAEGATLFMVLLAGFQILLGRLAGQTDLAVGTPVAGRRRVELEPLIGFFVNTLVLRADLSSDPGFRAHLAATRARVLEADAHQDVPFERLVEALAPDRRLESTPLFQVMLAFQNAPMEPARLAGLEVAWEEVPSGAPKFDLTLSLEECGGVLQGNLEFRRDRFDPTAVQRWGGHLETLLRAAVTAPEQRLGELPLLAAAERHTLLVEQNDTGVGALSGATLDALVTAQAARTPARIALAFRGGRLTYGELAARAERLAQALRGRGVGPEVRVGVCLERGPELVTALLAIHVAGGAYVPLDPLYPIERLAFMLEDSGAALVVTRTILLDRLPAEACPAFCLDQETPAGGPVLLPEPDAGRLSHVIYTSGSTGRPKGVAIGQRAAAALVGWAHGCFGLEELEGMLAATSVCFDLSVFELFVPLAAGGTVIVAENALDLPAHPDHARVRLLNTVPSAAAELARSGGLPPSLVTVSLAGEPLRRVLVEALADAGVPRVWNLYGPSEDTTYSTGVNVPLGEAEEPTIGRPIRGTWAFIVDPALRSVPFGVVGELCLGGAGLARGYLGRPGLSAERFVPDGLGGGIGERLYRTGDRARRRADGEIVFLGRLDQQVKVRGFRIEPGEIEARLLQHPAVETAAVLALPDAAGDLRLVAFVVPAATLDLEALRAQLGRRLPAHMVPGVFVELAALPQTASGKIDRKVLARYVPDTAPSAAGSGWRPRTPTEEILAAIWHELLGAPVTGLEAHFFTMGGHSLLAGRVLSRLREALGIELPLRRFFELPRFGELARAVEAARDEGRGAELPPLVAGPRPARLPLSFAQERMWFLDRFEPGPLYHLPAALDLHGRLEIAALAGALDEIVRRHEVLRTRLCSSPTGPVQEVDPPAPPSLPLVDLARLAPRAREAAAGAVLTQAARRPFDLAAGALVRFLLVRRSAVDHTLLVALHHAAADGWSLGVLMAELEALYGALFAGHPSPLPELPVQYADFALWQRGWLTGATLETEMEVWRRRLADLTPLELPTDRPRAALKGVRGATVAALIPAELTGTLRELARREGATLFMTLLAAFQALLGRLTGAADVAVGTPVAGRSRLELEPMIGFFVNTLVLRSELRALDPAGDPSFAQLLAGVRERALEAWAHQDVPFEKLVGELAPRRDLSRTPLFQVAFALQSGLGRLPRLPGLEVSAREMTTATAKLDLTLTLVETETGELPAAIEYDRDLFDATTVRRLLGRFERVLAAVVERPAIRLSHLPLLGAAERWQLLGEWNDTARPTAAGSVLELIAERVSEDPWALAVAGGGERWSHGELARRSGGLTHRLRALGAGPETVVAVCAERSPAMIGGLLGVLRTGAAYLPLDPAYPPERLAFMLADARVAALVTQRSLAPRFAELGVPLVVLEEVEPATDARIDEPLPHPESLAYVIYTSGSTGKPKGVAICHRTLLGLVSWHLEAFGVGAADRATQIAGPAFDASVWEIWPYLVAGASLHVPAEAVRAAPAELAGWLVTEAITVSFLPSPLAEAVLARAWPVNAPLRILLTGGDRLQTRPRAEHGFALVNCYGPTENTVVATGAKVRPEGEGLPSIGRPIARVETLVVDRRLEPVPLGTHGELLVGGAELARGYLRRPGLTAERFVPDPFADLPGARLYRTGDLVRQRADGALDFLGRIDHQVKVRGFRIELGEIEAVLTEHPALVAAAVIAVGPGRSETRLVGFVVASKPMEPAAWREWLGRRLPEHMVPGVLTVLEALPQTANGKVDRAALTRLAATVGREPDRPYAPPEAPLERVIAEVWKRVLGCERVGLDDNFFELGGDSLKMARVVEGVGEAAGRKVAVVDGFRYPTVRALAHHLGETAGGKPAVAETELLREAHEAAQMRREARGGRRDRRLGLR